MMMIGFGCHRYLTLLVVLGVLLGSCSAPPAKKPAGQPTGPGPAPAEPVETIRPLETLSDTEKDILLLTDQILLALATHDYARLESLLRAGGAELDGRQIAVRLLGAGADQFVLDRWDAGNIRIALADDQRQATSAVPVTYRRSPNRRPRRAQFTFHFLRAASQDPWRLQLE